MTSLTTPPVFLIKKQLSAARKWISEKTEGMQSLELQTLGTKKNHIVILKLRLLRLCEKKTFVPTRLLNTSRPPGRRSWKLQLMCVRWRFPLTGG